MGHPVCVTDQC